MRKLSNAGKDFARATVLGGLLYLSSCSKNSTGPEHDGPSLPPPANELSENTHVMSQAEQATITGYDGSALTLSAPSTYSAGDYLVCDTTSSTPDGLLRRIDSLSSDKKTLYTSSATIPEAVKRGSFRSQYTLTPETIGTIPLLKGATLRASESSDFDFNYSIDTVLYDVDGNLSTLEDQVRFGFAMDFSTAFDLDFDIDEQGLSYLSFTNTSREEARVRIYSGAPQLLISKEFPLGQIPFPTVLLGTLPTIPPFPMWGKPVIDFKARVIGYADSLSATATQSTTLEAGVEYRSGRFAPIFRLDNDFTYDLPFLRNDMGVKALAGSRLNLYILSLAGPYAEAFPFLSAHANFSEEPAWRLYGGLQVNAGISSNVFGNHSGGIPLYEDSLLLLQAPTSDAPTATLAASPATGTPPLEVLLDASGSHGDKPLTTYTFDFGDGATYTETAQNNDGVFDGKVRHTYSTEGDFWAKVNVIDEMGRTNKDSALVKLVANVNPQLRVGGIPGSSSFTITPDGNTFVLSVVEQESSTLINYSIETMNLDGTNRKTIYTETNQTLLMKSFDISPEGTHLVFTEHQITYEGEPPLQILSLDGTFSQEYDPFKSLPNRETEKCFTPRFVGSKDTVLLHMPAPSMQNTPLNEIYWYVPSTGALNKIATFVEPVNPHFGGIFMNLKKGSSTQDLHNIFLTLFDFYNVVNDTQSVRLTTSPSIKTYPTLSPDGTKIAFKSGNYALRMVNTDGTNEREILEADNFVWFPQWSPDGQTLYFMKRLSAEEVGIFSMPAPQ